MRLTLGAPGSEQNYSDLQVKHPPSQNCNPSQSAVPLLTVWRSWICSLCPPAFPFFLFPEARRKIKGPSAICTNHLLVTGVWKANWRIQSFLLFPVFTVLFLQDCEAAASDYWNMACRSSCIWKKHNQTTCSSLKKVCNSVPCHNTLFLSPGNIYHTTWLGLWAAYVFWKYKLCHQSFMVWQ